MYTVTTDRITPARAEKMLNSNKSNRKLREGQVEKYASDMRNGAWTQCVDPIVFYDDGDLADGQHRLWAIVESGTTQTFIVVQGISRADGLNINTGLIRSLVDNARISGANANLSNRLISVARAVEQGSRWGAPGTAALSAAQTLEYVERHSEAAHWALANAPRGRAFSHAIVLAAMARAWYHEPDKARLAQFAEVLTTGFMNEHGDGAAIALRNWLGSCTGFGRSDIWRDAFLRTQNAIHYFMRRKKLTIIRSVAEEAYPLPKAESAAKAPRRKKAA